MAEEIKHPLFARFFDRMSRRMEKDIAPYRDQLLERLSGRVVEIGPGNGLNFPHYPTAVDEVIAVEPEPYFREKAKHAAQDASVDVAVQAGVADQLGLSDHSADAVVCSFVLCSVPDEPAALAEFRRVLKPGGQFRFLEHVRSTHAAKARLQSALDATIWPRLGGGCHCGRDTVAALGAAGFSLERVRRFDIGASWSITNPCVLGCAR